MYLEIFYFLLLGILFLLIYLGKLEFFDGNTTQSTSNIYEIDSVGSTTRSLDEMEIINLSLNDRIEKKKRDERSDKFENCISTFGKKQSQLRDINEIMFGKSVESCNIFDKTSVGRNRKYYNQFGFW